MKQNYLELARTIAMHEIADKAKNTIEEQDEDNHEFSKCVQEDLKIERRIAYFSNHGIGHDKPIVIRMTEHGLNLRIFSKTPASTIFTNVINKINSSFTLTSKIINLSNAVTCKSNYRYSVNIYLYDNKEDMYMVENNNLEYSFLTLLIENPDKSIYATSKFVKHLSDINSGYGGYEYKDDYCDAIYSPLDDIRAIVHEVYHAAIRRKLHNPDNEHCVVKQDTKKYFDRIDFTSSEDHDDNTDICNIDKHANISAEKAVVNNRKCNSLRKSGLLGTFIDEGISTYIEKMILEDKNSSNVNKDIPGCIDKINKIGSLEKCPLLYKEYKNYLEPIDDFVNKFSLVMALFLTENATSDVIKLINAVSKEYCHKQVDQVTSLVKGIDHRIERIVAKKFNVWLKKTAKWITLHLIKYASVLLSIPNIAKAIMPGRLKMPTAVKNHRITDTAKESKDSVFSNLKNNLKDAFDYVIFINQKSFSDKKDATWLLKGANNKVYEFPNYIGKYLIEFLHSQHRDIISKYLESVSKSNFMEIENIENNIFLMEDEFKL